MIITYSAKRHGTNIMILVEYQCVGGRFLGIDYHDLTITRKIDTKKIEFGVIGS